MYFEYKETSVMQILLERFDFEMLSHFFRAVSTKIFKFLADNHAAGGMND